MKVTRLFLWLGLLLPPLNANAQSVWTDKPITRQQKKQILHFVQDIVSVGEEEALDSSYAPNWKLAQWSIFLVALHHMNLVEDVKTKEKYDIRLASHYVTGTVSVYFSREVKAQSFKDWKYKNGYYYGHSELFEQLGLDEIKKVRVYGVGASHLTAYVDFVNGMASGDFGRDIIQKTKMRLKKVSSKGKSHYILISYKILSLEYPPQAGR